MKLEHTLLIKSIEELRDLVNIQIHEMKELRDALNNEVVALAGSLDNLSVILRQLPKEPDNATHYH